MGLIIFFWKSSKKNSFRGNYMRKYGRYKSFFMQLFSADARIFFSKSLVFLPTKGWKKHPQKLLRKTQIYFFFSLLPWALGFRNTYAWKLEKYIPKLAKHTSPIAHFFHCFLFLFHQFLTQTVTKLI